MRSFSILISLIALACSQTVSAELPNVVLIISDDQGASDFGFMGHPSIKTPHIDRLARQSLRFPNGYVPSSVCRPSLATLLTGLYPHQSGIYFNHPPPGFAKLRLSANKLEYDALRRRTDFAFQSKHSLPRTLANNGYVCLQTGKYWEGHYRNAGFTHGMTTAEASSAKHGNLQLQNGDMVAHGNGDSGLTIGRSTMDPIRSFLKEHKEQPFFIWYAPFLPHLPHDAPERFVSMYEQSEIAPHQRRYFAACSWFDHTVGELMELLEQSEKLDNTIIVFVVDNGFEPDEHQLMRGGDYNYSKHSKRSPFEAGLRTPILIRWDKHVSPDTRHELCSSIDIVPTILAASDVESNKIKLPGRDLLDSQDKSDVSQHAIFGEIYPGDATQLGNPAADIAYRWIRDGKYKLIVPHQHGSEPPWGAYVKETSLYDVVNDPEEQHNLIDNKSMASTAKRLRSMLDRWWNPKKGN